MVILDSTNSSIKKASTYLKKNKLVAFPTETVYGVGAIFSSHAAYLKLNKLKRRKPNKPYTLMLGDVNDITKFAVLNKKQKAFIKKVLPGPITLLLKAKPNLARYIYKDKVIGVRVPSHKIALKLLKEVGEPLLVPSLNRSGEPPMNDLKMIKKEFGHELDAIIAYKIKKDKPSTVISLCDKIKVIREGKIPSKKIIEVYNKL